MDCFQDCCLYCDRDSQDGAYCSEQCKLADHDRASSSGPSSPVSPALSQWISSQAVNIDSRPQSTYFSSTTPPSTSTHERQLSPSSSRTSLSSTTSLPLGAVDAIATQAKQDLQGYFSSFDQVRAAKRRSSVRSGGI